MRAKLTASAIPAFAPAEKPYDVRDTEIRGFLLRVMPSGSMTYYFQYRNDKGRQANFRIGSAGSLKPRQARDVAESLSARVASGGDIQLERKEGRARGDLDRARTWGAFLELRFGPWIEQHRRQGGVTLKRLEANFSEFKARPVSEINQWVIDKWRAGRLKDGIAKSTLNRDVGDLKAALAKAVEWGLLDVSPLAKLKPYKVDRLHKVRYLSPDEDARLKAALEARDAELKEKRQSGNSWRTARGYELLPSLDNQPYGDYLTPLVILAMHTGLRRGELFALKWADVDFSRQHLSVHGAQSKSGQTRHIPLNREAREALIAWRRQAPRKALVFPGDDDATLTTIKKAWSGLCRRARLEQLRFHDLRHDFASKLVMAGVPLNTVRDLLGHSDIQTTLRYAHLAPDHKASAVEALTRPNRV